METESQTGGWGMLAATPAFQHIRVLLDLDMIHLEGTSHGSRYVNAFITASVPEWLSGRLQE